MAKLNNIISPQKEGLFRDLVQRIKLILRLIGDKRVSLLLKLLPVAAAVYVVSPVDLVPGLVLPLVGALDDAAVIWLGTTLFVSLCPETVVQEHSDALANVIPGSWRPSSGRVGEEEIIDAVAMDADQAKAKPVLEPPVEE